MVDLTTKTIHSKKNDKDYTAHILKIGDWESPIFFPTPIELTYIEEHLND